MAVGEYLWVSQVRSNPKAATIQILDHVRREKLKIEHLEFSLNSKPTITVLLGLFWIFVISIIFRYCKYYSYFSKTFIRVIQKVHQKCNFLPQFYKTHGRQATFALFFTFKFRTT